MKQSETRRSGCRSTVLFVGEHLACKANPATDTPVRHRPGWTSKKRLMSLGARSVAPKGPTLGRQTIPSERVVVLAGIQTKGAEVGPAAKNLCKQALRLGSQGNRCYNEGGSLSGNQVCRCNRSKVAPRALLGRFLWTDEHANWAGCVSVRPKSTMFMAGTTACPHMSTPAIRPKI